jgi:hypothetical protein
MEGQLLRTTDNGSVETFLFGGPPLDEAITCECHACVAFLIGGFPDDGPTVNHFCVSSHWQDQRQTRGA